MVLKLNNEKKIGLNHPLRFGRCEGSTVREVIDDGQCSYVQWMVNEQLIELDNEAYEYLRIVGCCGSVCNSCQNVF